MANIVYYEDIQLVDNVKLIAGTSSDIQIYTDNSNNILDFFNLSNVLFRQHFLDGDMTFQCDDGSGGVTTYFKLDGGNTNVSVAKDFLFQDNVRAEFGNAGDFDIYHDGSNSFLENNTGDLSLVNYVNDADIKFKSDNGSGGVTDYFVVDGGLVANIFYKRIKLVDDVQLQIGSNPDLLIYHDGSNSYINEDGTGDLYIQTNGNNMFLRDKSSGDTFIAMNTGTADVVLKQGGNTKLTTKSSGISVTGDIVVSGDVEGRDIPCVLTSNFSDDSSTTSYLFLPFNNNSESSSNQYYNYFAAPQAGKVVSIMIMHVSGSMSSSFTTQLRVTKNGSAADTSGELTPSNGTSDGSYVEYAPGTTFAKGDRLQFSYQKSAGSKYWRGATATIVIELTDYDI